MLVPFRVRSPFKSVRCMVLSSVGDCFATYSCLIFSLAHHPRRKRSDLHNLNIFRLMHLRTNIFPNLARDTETNCSSKVPSEMKMLS